MLNNSFIIPISCFLNFLFRSAINVNSFSVRSSLTKDFVKVSKLFNGFFHSFFLVYIHHPYLPPTSFLGSAFWLSLSNHDSPICERFADSLLSTSGKGFPPFSKAFFYIVATNPIRCCIRKLISYFFFYPVNEW